MVRGPRSKHIGLWSTDLEPRIVGLESRFKLSGSRLVGAGPGLLKLVAGSGSNWVEGVGRMFAVLAARTEGGDGEVETKLPFFIRIPHLVLQVGVDVTYSVTSCAAPS
jgi:hypothetical protein